jgi:hypothetical protein
MAGKLLVTRGLGAKAVENSRESETEYPARAGQFCAGLRSERV